MSIGPVFIGVPLVLIAGASVAGRLILSRGFSARDDPDETLMRFIAESNILHASFGRAK